MVAEVKRGNGWPDYRLSSSDQAFRHDFQSGRIGPGVFDHRAHVRLAYICPADDTTQTALTRSSDLHCLGSSRTTGSNIMLTHYSTDLLFSSEARDRFVDPDRDEIPQHVVVEDDPS